MILDVSAAASDAMLDAIGGMLVDANLEILTDGSELLVTLKISDPGVAIDGELVFKLDAGLAVMTGEAKFGRVVDANGTEVIAFDVGPEGSDCTLKLTPTDIHAGTGVRLDSFRLVMP